MMPSFELYQPSTIDDALALLDQFGKDAWVLAGAKDSLNMFKDRVKRPKAVIEITGIESMKGIRETSDGIEIGALTTLTEIETSPLIQAKFRVLADSVRRAASPQIRNAGTIGGNVAQDSRCWYYQDGMPCYRAGGNTCFADTPAGQNREHALFEVDRCISVSPSDSAPALLVLEAKFVIRNSRGERVVDAEDFWIGPKIDITRMTVLKDGDILTAIRIPNTWAGAQFYFEKASDRQTWDFPLVNVASAIRTDGGVITAARVAVGAVENRPRLVRGAGASLSGEQKGEEIAAIVGKTSVRGARPLNFNQYKIPLMQNLVKRAIRDAA
jgi:xanthine dehydrogenase YagS FAD-binding subunit